MTEFQANIRSTTGQDCPWMLSSPDFNSTHATDDEYKLDHNITNQVLGLVWETVKDRVFHAACPGHVSEPYTAVRTISQVIKDKVGNTTILSCQAYFKVVINASHAFSARKVWPYNVVTHFASKIENSSHFLQGTRKNGHV